MIAWCVTPFIAIIFFAVMILWMASTEDLGDKYMIPNGKEMTWKGHHLVFESEPNPCRGCFFADKDECPDCDDGAWVEDNTEATK